MRTHVVMGGDLEKKVRSVLLSSSKGVLLRKFCGEYRGLVKELFPWRKLGIRYKLEYVLARALVSLSAIRQATVMQRSS